MNNTAIRELQDRVYRANLELKSCGLVVATFGNVSGIDRDSGIVAIKPSGVPYEELSPRHMVLVDLDYRVMEGDLNPSSDTKTHVMLYKSFPEIGAVVHTHSKNATAWAQAGKPLPCLGTTHADHFDGSIPVTRVLRPDEVAEGYEPHTGDVIIERLAGRDPLAMPAVLVAGHAPFVWGRTVAEALDNAVALEAVAEMALLTRALDPAAPFLEPHLLDKHFGRKHGTSAYYGQRPPEAP